MRATQAKLKFKNNPCAENSASTKTEISSARVEFKILKVALVVRDFICAKNEILSVKKGGGGILKFKNVRSVLCTRLDFVRAEFIHRAEIKILPHKQS